MITQNKRGAMEMSVGTIVTIVLLMTVLILGLVLIRNIFSGSTDSIDAINADVLTQINDLFGDEDKPIIVALGYDNVAKVKDDTQNFGVAVIFNSIDGNTLDVNKFRYFVELDEDSTRNCVATQGMGLTKTKALFNKKLGAPLTLESINGRIGGARIGFDIPKGTPKCSQIVKITAEQNGVPTGLASFTIEII